MTTVRTPSFQLATYQAGSKSAPRLALLLPGLLDTKDYPHMIELADYLARRDYLAISFDPPGSWESGDDIGEYTMSNYLKAIDELIALHHNKPTVLIGHSLGGLIACLSAGRNANVQAFVSIMSPYAVVRFEEGEDRAVHWPVTKWQKLNIRPARRDVPGDPTQKRVFELPFSFVEDARAYNSLDLLATLTIPKLFVAGDQDTITRTKDVRQTYQAAAEPKQFAHVGSNHDYRLQPDLVTQVNTIIGDFLQDHLQQVDS